MEPAFHAPTTVPAAAAACILYVDDEETIRRLYGEVLSRAGYSVELAENGERGWEALQRKAFDLLITDHSMPVLSGLKLAVRARAAGLDLPIIIASGCATFAEDDAYAWLQLSTLRKPFAPVVLLEAVVASLRAAKHAAEVIKSISQTAPILIPNTAETDGPLAAVVPGPIYRATGITTKMNVGANDAAIAAAQAASKAREESDSTIVDPNL